MKKFKSNLLIICILMPVTFAMAQDPDGAALLRFEQSIDNAVVTADIPFLEKAFADDFRFKHGTGLVDSKASWIKTARESKGKYLSRQIDSVEVEIHGKVGITNGKLTVHRQNDKGDSNSYQIKYVRVYVRSGKDWQMISHRTVWQK